MIRVAAVLGVLTALATGVPSLGQQQNPILGTWVTDDQAEITIAFCPQGLCGSLSRIVIPDEHAASREKIDEIGIENLTDANNKDPALRGRPLLGLDLLVLDKQLSETAFEGEIYNPQNGDTYYGKLELMDRSRIKLTGCALIVVCLSQEWYRVPSDNPPPMPTPVADRPR